VHGRRGSGRRQGSGRRLRQRFDSRVVGCGTGLDRHPNLGRSTFFTEDCAALDGRSALMARGFHQLQSYRTLEMCANKLACRDAERARADELDRLVLFAEMHEHQRELRSFSVGCDAH
jgi:hypothetical protein